MSNRTVFLVDDDEAIRHSASFMLRHAGFLVKTYPDGMTFLEQVSSDNEGCILLDVRMPGMDGFTTTTELKKLAGNADVPVIGVSGHTTDREECLEAGMSDFLAKPVLQSDLVSALERWVEAA